MKIMRAAVLLFLCTLFASSEADTLGPARSAEQFAELIATSSPGDTILIHGDIDLEGRTIAIPSAVTVTSDSSRPSVLRGLTLRDASVSFQNIRIEGTLNVEGTSGLSLGSGTQVRGQDGQPGLQFTGGGFLIAEPGSEILGGSGASGVIISHNGGDFYAGLEGQIKGGTGNGDGVTVSPLSHGGALVISGSVSGGSSSSLGGNAVNLYDLRDDALVSITGDLSGGSGAVGGSGIEVVSLNDRAYIGVSGRISGGEGEQYGGNAVLLMSATGSSSVSLAGELLGGDTSTGTGEPGSSLLIADNASIPHAIVNDCLLQDGGYRKSTAAPLPEITSSIAMMAELEPTPLPPLYEGFLESQEPVAAAEPQEDLVLGSGSGEEEQLSESSTDSPETGVEDPILEPDPSSDEEGSEPADDELPGEASDPSSNPDQASEELPVEAETEDDLPLSLNSEELLPPELETELPE